MKQACFSEKTLFLNVSAAVSARFILQSSGQVSARVLILQGFPMALGLTAISTLLAQAEQNTDAFSGNSFRPKLLCGGFVLWFVWELAETLQQAQTICWMQFSSMAVLGLLPLLLWAGWKLEPGVLARSVPVLGWTAALAALVWLGALRGQLHWENLMRSTTSSVPTMPLYAECFVLPFLCKREDVCRGIWLPFKAFCVMAALAFGAEFLFGPGGIPAGVIGSLTHVDAVVLLVWLALALFRVCVLVQVVRQLLCRICKREEPMGEGL